MHVRYIASVDQIWKCSTKSARALSCVIERSEFQVGFCAFALTLLELHNYYLAYSAQPLRLYLRLRDHNCSIRMLSMSNLSVFDCVSASSCCEAHTLF
eukprot:6206546-Pleurochrysis_carterae.AAC.1